MKQTNAMPKRRGLEDACQDDVALAQAASTGDSSSQTRLVKRIIDRVQRTVAYLSSGSEDAKDLAQLALVQIVRSAGSFRGDCSLEYWADRIAVQTAAKQFAKKKRRKILRDTNWSPIVAFHDMEEEIALIQLRRRLAEIIATLPQKQRIPLVLFYLHEYEIAEIAEMTGTKINTVRGRLRCGRSRIRKKILADPTLSTWVQEEKI